MDDMHFDVAPCNGDIKRLVIAHVEGEEIHRSTVNTNSADSRSRFLKQVAVKTQADASELLSKFDQPLVQLADEADAAADADANSAALSADDGSEGERKSQATLLVELVQKSQTQLFHDPDGNCYARYPLQDHFEVARISSGNFKRWMAKLFYDAIGKTPNSQAKADAA